MPKGITEFGYEDPVEKQGKWRLLWPKIREVDPWWLDGPIKDSKLGKAGVDMSFKTEPYYREKPHLSEEEWKKDLYFSSPNIKRIYDNWDISKEHPGFTVQPYLYGPEAPLYTFSNVLVMPSVISNRLGKYFPPLVWSFYDGPFGTNCLKKTVAPARTMTYLATTMWMFNVCYYNPAKTVMDALRTYPKFCGVPIIAAAAWGSLSCFACQFRQKDDWKNMAFASLGVGLVASTKYSVMRCITYTLVVGVLSSMWRVGLDFEMGLFGRGGPQKQFYFRDPLSWQWMSLETKWRDVPPRNW